MLLLSPLFVVAVEELLVVKLFITRRGAFVYRILEDFGCFWDFRTSLLREKLSTRKCNVGPRGVIARRMFVFPEGDFEKRSRWVTPSGPAMVV